MNNTIFKKFKAMHNGETLVNGGRSLEIGECFNLIWFRLYENGRFFKETENWLEAAEWILGK